MAKEEHLATIKQADHEYYDLDNPSISDAEYGAEDLNYVPGAEVKQKWRFEKTSEA